MRSRALHLALVGVPLGALLFVSALGARSFLREYQSFDTPRATVHTREAKALIPSLDEVSFTSDGAQLRGWYAPGREKASVVLVHGTNGSRQDVLAEMQLLSERGFHVLAFDLPGQGESDGVCQWDRAERGAIESALDFLDSRKETHGHPVGVFGFSLGGYVAIQAAARDPRIRAIAVAGTPANLRDHTRFEHHGSLAAWPSLLAMQVHGMHLDELVPERIASSLSPRPLLVVAGARDTVVDPALVRRLYDAAEQPKTWLSLPDAEHGDYAAAAPSVYPTELTTFFARALLTQASANAALEVR